MKRANTKHAPDEICCVEFCNNRATILHMCGACYQYEYSWARRSMADRSRHLNNLRKREARMERLAPRGRHLRSVK